VSIDYRTRCVVRNGAFDRIYYGITAADYNANLGAITLDAPEIALARDLCDTFDHSEGRGRQATGSWTQETTRHFFTQNMGRGDQAAWDNATAGRTRR
jgi:hypothetical protein